jgi:ABC-type sugar transport system ATPase subunit
MVFATHYQEQAMALGDRIAVIRNGLIHQVDATQDIYLRPKN